MADPDRALIVMPTYNEVDNLAAILPAIHGELPEAHILVVDDGSPDGTGRLADQLSSRDPRIHVLHRSGKLGLGTAYIAGFRYALAHGYQYVFEMDADFSHDPRYLPALLASGQRGIGLTLGSRYVKGGGTRNWGLGRQLISRGGGLYARTILGIKVRDMTAGYRCYRREVLAALDLHAIRSEGYSFQIEMTYRVIQAGFRVEEIPIVFEDRRVGQSKMSRRIFMEALLAVWRLRLG